MDHGRNKKRASPPLSFGGSPLLLEDLRLLLSAILYIFCCSASTHFSRLASASLAAFSLVFALHANDTFESPL